MSTSSELTVQQVVAPSSPDVEAVQERYQKLLADFCTLAGVKNPQSLMERGAIAIDGILLCLLFDATLDPNHIYIQVDLGELEEERYIGAAQALLEQNLLVAYHPDGGVFGISAENQHPIFRLRLPFNDDLTVHKFTHRMIHYAHEAQEWQRETVQLPTGDANSPGTGLSNKV